MARKKLGILGGTFDPIHLGHVHLAEAVYDALNLEALVFIPAFIAPHKVGHDFAPAKARLAMTRLAVAGKENYFVSDREVVKTGVSYTINTLQELHKENPDYDLYFIIGADSLTQLHTWHRIQEMLQLTTFVAAGRPGYRDPLDIALKNLGEAAKEKIILLETPEYEISSTEIRTRIRQGLSLEGLVPPAVEAYIKEKKLYLKGEDGHA